MLYMLIGKSKNTSDDVNFDDDDDDDPLFGIDSPPNKRKSLSGKSSNPDDGRPESGKSVLDELFGRKSEKSLLSSAEQKMTFDSFNYSQSLFCSCHSVCSLGCSGYVSFGTSIHYGSQ